MSWNQYDNVTTINCVYPISGAYGLLPRVLYYLTLVAAIFGRSREWLVIGALVSALTYAGTSSVHMMTLVRSRTGAFDLDILAAWAVLSTGALGYIGMMHWSSTMRNSRARMVMILWGALVGMGLIFGRALLFDTPASPGEKACWSTTATSNHYYYDSHSHNHNNNNNNATDGSGSMVLLTQVYQLQGSEFNCTYTCFGITKPLRQWSEIMAVPSQLVHGRYSSLSFVLVGPIQFAAYAAVSADSASEHTPSALCTRLVMKHLLRDGGYGRAAAAAEDLTKVVYKASMESWYGGYFVFIGYIRRVRWCWLKVRWASVLLPWLALSFAIDVLCLPLMVANIVLNEVTLLGGGFPVNEANMNIGQWGPVVSSLLVVIAACVNKGTEWWEERRTRRKKCRECEPGEGDVVVEEVTVVAGKHSDDDDDGQVLGVVKPKMVHVHTLQDMEDLRRPG
ncbi:hypothetical protein PV08_05925 [Exophiala spinifera]|uniref:Uncharacterized protein n=1 Tax=Exophiala spinifera TaxID=91928 RepID=A0A0D2BB82_9EURO|nr:uncharacterized protein PV08_05925 [Exophiala spinifera]KIW15875.1 hypothetical protein PV08_05925 [Exophiala spinifera]